MICLLSSVELQSYCIYNFADFLYSDIVSLQLWFGWFLLLHHCFIAIMIWLISSMVPLFNIKFDLAVFPYWTTVLLPLRFGRFYLTLVSRLLYCIYDFADLFCCSTVWLQLSFGSFLLFHHCFLEIKIWLTLFDFSYTIVWFQLSFGWSLLLHHCFIAITIRLISSIPPLFYCNYN